jgi:hypothetical protein
MGKVEVRTDVFKNRLYVMLEGFFSTEEMKKQVDNLVQEVKKLKPGFDVINDISRFKPTTPQGAEEMTRAQQSLQAAGVGRIIRIVESASLSEMQFTRTAKEAGYAAETATSVEEAEKMLDRGK